MKYTYLAATALALVFGAQVGAQGTSTKDAPAELPPASYTASQYVDSRGCVFIRAGVDGNTAWVARLTRQRRHVCGMEPTRLTDEAPVAVTPRRGVEQITLDLPEDGAELASADAVSATPSLLRPRLRAETPVVSAQPAPERVARATNAAAPKVANVKRPRWLGLGAPTPTIASNLPAAPIKAAAPVRRRTEQIAPTPAPKRPRAVAAAATVQKVALRDMALEGPAPVSDEVRAACKGRAVISAQYINSGQHIRVRCGRTAQMAKASQGARNQVATGAFGPLRAAAPTRRANTVFGTPVPATSLPEGTRVTPLGVFKNKVPRIAYPAPKGYRPAWQDDRLNSNRAEGTIDGWAAMDLKWTNTVPRRLINRVDGRDVTAKVPLVYPFTDVAAQESQLGHVTLGTRNGLLVKRILRLPGAPSALELEQNPDQVMASSEPSVRATVSTRSVSPKVSAAPVRAKPKAVRGKSDAKAVQQFVQVALFAEPSNARNTAQKLANRGLPMRISKLQRNGRSFDIVSAGPFTDAGRAEAALKAVRQAGFGDAYLRR